MAYNNREYIPKFLTATNTQVFTGRGIVHTVLVGTTAATALQLCDATSAATSGTTVILKASVAEGTYVLDAVFAKGLNVTSSLAGSYTITYTQG